MTQSSGITTGSLEPVLSIVVVTRRRFATPRPQRVARAALTPALEDDDVRDTQRGQRVNEVRATNDVRSEPLLNHVEDPQRVNLKRLRIDQHLRFGGTGNRLRATACRWCRCDSWLSTSSIRRAGSDGVPGSAGAHSANGARHKRKQTGSLSAGKSVARIPYIRLRTRSLQSGMLGEDVFAFMCYPAS